MQCAIDAVNLPAEPERTSVGEVDLTPVTVSRETSGPDPSYTYINVPMLAEFDKPNDNSLRGPRLEHGNWERLGQISSLLYLACAEGLIAGTAQCPQQTSDVRKRLKPQYHFFHLVYYAPIAERLSAIPEFRKHLIHFNVTGIA